ncbi:MAG: D-2-hydroxyacid dehydrogenase [Bacillota bacterium]
MTARKQEELKVLMLNPWVDQYVPLVKEKFPTLNLVYAKKEDDLEGIPVDDVEVVVSNEPLSKTLPRIKNLKWFQCLSTGYDHILGTGLVKKETILTNVAGVAAIPVSEFVMALLLSIVKRLPELLENQRRHKFELFFPNRELYGKTIGVLGVGHIGRAVVKKAKAMGMVVLGFDKYVTEAEGADKIYPFDQLEAVLQASDFIVVCLPLNEETRGLIGEEQFRMMKPEAYFVNVARGEIVVREALVKALKEKWIAGSALDVFWGSAEKDGLEPDDELWDLPNVIITPHCAVITNMYVPRTTEIFCKNLERYLRGEQLINVIEH